MPKTQNKVLKHLKDGTNISNTYNRNKGISYVYFMIKLTFKSAVTHSRDIDLTRIVCIYNHHYQHLNVTECQCVWNTEKRDTKQNHHLVWCCTWTYEKIPMKSCAYPWSLGLCACHPCSLPEWWLHPWSLRLLPVQFTRAFVISSAPAPWQLARLIFKMLVSTRAAGAVQQIPCRIPGLCACHPCSLPEFRPQCSDGSIWRCRFRRSCCVEWFSRWLVPEIIPFAFPCCLSCICFGAGCAWWNRLCVEFSVVSCFRLPRFFADLVFPMIGIGH